MVNRWTGAYDAVIQIAPDGADRLLAAIHRKGNPPPGLPAPGPHLMHSTSVNLPLNGPIAGRNLRGHLEIQVSTPSVTVPAGSDGTRVTVSMDIFSWFQRAFGSDPAPEFLHGTLSLTVGLSVVQCQGELLIQVGLNGIQARFQPAAGSGASAEDVALVEAAVPAIVAQSIAPVQLHVGSLEAGGFAVRDLDFKTLQQGALSAFGLLLGLGDLQGPPPSPAGVTEIFLAPQDQAGVAIGREFLTRVLFENAQGPLSTVAVSGSRLGLSFSAKLDPPSLRLELQPGRLRISVDGSGSASVVGSYRFRLTLNFGLKVEQGRLALFLAPGTDVDITQGFLPGVIFGLFEGRIVDGIEDSAGAVIDAANAELNTLVDDSVRGLLEELAISGVGLEFTRAAIDPDAVILAATVDIGSAPPVVASFRRLDKQTPASPAATNVLSVELELNAFDSFIPGGTIRRYIWREVRGDGAVERQLTENHRFIARIQPELVIDGDLGAATIGDRPLLDTGAAASRFAGSSFDLSNLGWPPKVWCVEVQGTQVLSGEGPPATVSARVCALSVVVASLDHLETDRLPVLVPDGQGGALAAIDPWSSFRPHSLSGGNENRGFLLVHNPGSDVEAGIAALGKALPRDGRGPLVFATLISEQLGRGVPASLRAVPSLAVSHDPEKRWRERFRLAEPGTVILGPGGKEVFRARGPLRADELIKVLAGLPNGNPRPPRRTQLGLGFGLGELAPDIFFPCGSGLVLSLRKMGGREAQVVFWTSWSEPSLEELRRAAAAGRGQNGRGPLLLCVNDGEDPELAARTLAQLDPSLRLVPDPQRLLSRRFGVCCWPTTVRVDGAGRIADIRLGLDPAGAGSPGEQQPCAPSSPPYDAR
ncbi:MAG: TlpA family protein disulfide reductase [Planctomycetota bacterium]|nr:MAG: TlpA family protein disulfide reductase [Planctomycetota bacterium]